DVVIGQGASVNVSGGSVAYSAADISTTQLSVGNQRFDIGKASADVVYNGLSTAQRHVAAYTEGKSAGSFSVSADNKIVLDGDVRGSVTPGIYQQTPATAPKGGTLVVGDIYATRTISFMPGSGLSN